MSGDPKFEGSQDLPDFPYAALRGAARAQGHPRRAARRRSAPAWDEALASDRPVVLRGDHRPGGPAAAAAHHARAGQGAQLGAAGRRPERAADHQAVVQAEGRRSSCRADERPPPSSSRSASSELEVAAYTVPTDAPEADGTLAWDSTTIVVVHAHAPASDGPRLHVRRRLDRQADRVEAGRDRERPRRARAAGGVGGDGRADPQPGPSGHHLDGDRRRGRGAVGPQGAAARAPALHAARDGARPCARLRLGRLHRVLA